MNERVIIPIVVGNKVLSEGSDGVGQSVDPATGEVIASFARGGEVEVELAVAAAREAFDVARGLAAAPHFRETPGAGPRPR